MGDRVKMVSFLFVLLILFIVFASYIYNGYELYNQREDNYTYSKNQIRDYKIVINVDIKRLDLISNSDNEIIKSYEIATGKKDSPTPLGTFKIVEKAKWGEGFGTRWMGLDVPWGTYGIHGTNKPGSVGFNLSAGCIRMRNRDVEELYDYVGENTIVHISNGIYGEATKSSLLNYLKAKDMELTHTISTEIYNSLGIILME